MRTTWALLMALTTGCGHKVSLSYLAPAQIDLGQDVERVLVLDRSDPSQMQIGRQVLDTLEGLSSGEGFELDSETRELALQGLREVLEQSDRFEVVSLGADGKARELRKLCDKADCDAVVALDKLDSDGFVVMEAEAQREGPPEYEATRSSAVDATFRVYGADGQVLDEAVLSVGADATVESDRPSEALAAATASGDLRADLAHQVGASYGRRIAPHERYAVRTLYRTGSPELKQAIDQVKSDDWQAASDIWRELAKSSDNAQVVAKARHNLAVAAELEGRLDRALQLARNADDVLSRSRTTQYTLALEHRWLDQKRLNKQMTESLAAN
jgi:hypothetical protein